MWGQNWNWKQQAMLHVVRATRSGACGTTMFGGIGMIRYEIMKKTLTRHYKSQNPTERITNGRMAGRSCEVTCLSFCLAKLLCSCSGWLVSSFTYGPGGCAGKYNPMALANRSETAISGRSRHHMGQSHASISATRDRPDQSHACRGTTADTGKFL